MRLIDADMLIKDMYEDGNFPLTLADKATEKINNQRVVYANGWIPADEPPEDDKYILISFENYSVPIVGRYEEGEEGGAYYAGDEDISLVSQDMIVNAWQPLPDKYYEEESMACLLVDRAVVKRLKDSFAGSFVNEEGEFIAYKRANEYFILRDCETELDVQCKVLEWFSRGAFKTQRFDTDRENDVFHEFMLNGINKFLGTEFDTFDIEDIYTYLGNACNHEKTIAFIESGYIMTVLREYGK